MDSIVVGLGIQGKKRLAIAGRDIVATVDPVNPQADYKSVRDVPLDQYQAALICTPDEPKAELLTYLLSNSKHVLVEKPLYLKNRSFFLELLDLAKTRHVTCYTAYNHRFEPHFIRMKQVLDSGRLGKVYYARLFYGNGTAQLVRDSVWRDQGSGVLPDLGSHLLDTILFWFGKEIAPFKVYSANKFENCSFDYFSFGSNGDPALQFEVSLLSWRNHFYADVFAENGSAHIQSLCKWGPSSFILRERQRPSGRPNEEVITLTEPDPTWEQEYIYFKNSCLNFENNIENNIWISEVLSDLIECSSKDIK